MRPGAAVLVLTLAAAASLVLALLRPPSAELAAGGALAGTRVAEPGFPKRLVDPLGREHRLEAPPRRIVSAVLAGDEMLAALVSPERVAGVTYLADDPGISNVTGHFPATVARVREEVESLLALAPDLVLVASHTDAATVRLLLGAGVAVVRFPSFEGIADVAANLATLGEIVGEPAKAQALVEDIGRRLGRIRVRVAGRGRPRVLYYSPGGFTGGPGSLTDEMIQLAGGHNVVRDTGITGDRRITDELAIALQPEVVIVSAWTAGASPQAQMLRSDPAWRQVPAVRDGRIHTLRGAWVTSGSQHRIEGIEALARLLHPDAFHAG